MSLVKSEGWVEIDLDHVIAKHRVGSRNHGITIAFLFRHKPRQTCRSINVAW